MIRSNNQKVNKEKNKEIQIGLVFFKILATHKEYFKKKYNQAEYE